MITVISPAKTLDYQTPTAHALFSLPLFLNQSSELIKYCRQLSESELQKKMKISSVLAQLNKKRFEEWHPNFTPENAKQALFAFKGDVYDGLNALDFTSDDIDFAQKSLRILSGLYGLLKPLDLMQAYRLEMGTSLTHSRGKNLYEFWSDILTDQINYEMKTSEYSTLINLASEEYFKVLNTKKLIHPVIKPIFLDEKQNHYKVISFYAKKARGLMANFIIKQRLTRPDELKKFNSSGYRFDASYSTEAEWVFKRSEKDAQHNRTTNN